MSYRKYFQLPLKPPIKWMEFAEDLPKILPKLRNVDCIVEVHDARVPISGRNFEFLKNITQKGQKPHILLLNKKDLTDTCDQGTIRSQLKRGMDRHVLFTTTQKPNCTGIERIVPLVTELLPDDAHDQKENGKVYNIMLVGLPKVGKNSLNKMLRKKTRKNIGQERINTRNCILIHDKPNICLHEKTITMQPCIKNDETGLKMAIIGCLQEPVIDNETVADYLLFLMNKFRRYEYVKIMGLHKPSDNIARVLSNYSQNVRSVERSKIFSFRSEAVIDTNSAAKDFIGMFRAGEFGAFNLDQLL